MKKLRICTLYLNDRGRNDGSPLYTFRVMRDDMKDLVDVVHLLPYGDIREFGEFDLYLWVDHGEDNFPDVMESPFVCPKPNIYWVSDLHWSQASADYRIRKAKEFDLVCCNHPQHVNQLKAALGHDRVAWVPFAVEPLAYPRETAIKKYDCCFVGHLNTPHRVEFLDQMFKTFPNSWWSKKFFEKAASVFHEAKICLNMSVASDLNMRNFEVLGAGGFLLTDEAEGLKECFTLGEHLVTYTSIPDAMEKARYYLTHDEERERIAEAGHHHVLKHHTYRHRVDTLLRLAHQHGLIGSGYAHEQREEASAVSAMGGQA